MKIIWITPLLIFQNYRGITGSHFLDEYNQYSFYQKRPLSPRPLDAMTDLTNDLGVCVLRIIAAGGAVGNIAFSPFGLMAVSVLLYEGSSGYSALQIKQSLNLPWEILAVRIGVRDLNRHLKTYFKSDGFLNGLTLNREEVCLRPQFKRVLQLYGFDNPNSFLVDSCPESSTTTTQPISTVSVTTQGTVLTEMTPTSQVIQISTNITNGSASEISTVATEFPAKVTYLGDASFTISNIDTNVTNTSPSMNSQTDTMVVDIDTQPLIRPIESSTNQQSIIVSINKETPKSPNNEIEVINENLNKSFVAEAIVASTTPIILNTIITAAPVSQVMSTDYSPLYSNSTINSQIEKIIETTSNSDTNSVETTTSTTQLYNNTTHVVFNTTENENILNTSNVTTLRSNLHVTSAKNENDVTNAPFTEVILPTISDGTSNMINDQHAVIENTAETMMMPTTNRLNIGTDITMTYQTTPFTKSEPNNNETTQSMYSSSVFEIISSTKSMSNDYSTSQELQTNTIPTTITDRTTLFSKSELNNNETTQSMDTTSEAEIISSTKPMSNDDSTTQELQTNTIPITITDQTTLFSKAELNINETTQSMDTTSVAEIISSTNSMSNDDSTIQELQTNTIPITITDQTTSFTKSELNNDIITVSENPIYATNVVYTTVNSSNMTENEIINEAESSQHYQIAFLDKKTARSLESKDLPTFDVEFVVRKEDIQIDCNQTKKTNFIKPDKILMEYPTNSGISVTTESKKRKRRYLEQYQGYNSNLFTGYRPPSGWIDRSSDSLFESMNFFNAGYRRIPYFTYTAVLPFGFIFELKSQVIEIPLDDPKYTLMIMMPNNPASLSELLLLLPSMSLRNIHNSLKPTAVHATIPSFRYTAKIDLTSALQQIGIQDVFYRYRADLSFMSPDARLFVNSVHQVVSVTAKKYNTPPVYEIQRKYVEHNFVVSKPFVYFVIDVHTKVSLIAGVITDPLASPIWI